MCKEDVAQVTEIDREAFPTQWPPINYQHELRSQLTHYIVAYDEEKSIVQPSVKAPPEKDPTGLASRLRRLFSHNRSLSIELPPPDQRHITGFVGLWVLADEAHITSIAVREAFRRQGTGELLIISAIDLATKLKTRLVTLEARISNTAAQNLYSKYGFTQVGLRRAYYTDNREDAVVMTTPDITSGEFQTRFKQLKQAYYQTRE